MFRSMPCAAASPSAPRAAALSLLAALLLLVPSGRADRGVARRPNIVFILADDIGLGDLSYTGGPIDAPELAALAAESVRIKIAYAAPLCTPTRAALLTARYPHNVGLNGALLTGNPYGLAANHSTLADWLRGAGYKTHMVGKWHLGHSKWEYTPTMHGFDEHYGIFGLGVDPYDKTLEGGADLWHNRRAVYERTHTTELFAREAVRVIDRHHAQHRDQPLFLYLAFTAAHTPLVPDLHHVRKCTAMRQEWRRDFCGLVVGLDEAIGNVTAALKRTGLWDDTLLVFSSDNGGDAWSGGHNYPLRGVKHTAWEGGMRVPAFIRSPRHFGRGGYDFTAGPLHMTDWAPTLLALANVTRPATATNLDGLDMSRALKTNSNSPRNETVLVLDDASGQYAIRSGRWKLMFGHVGDGQLYLEPTEWINGCNSIIDRLYETAFFAVYRVVGTSFGMLMVQFLNLKRHENNVRWGFTPDYDHLTLLFDLESDPNETTNLAEQHPDVVQRLRARMDELQKQLPVQYNWMVKDKNNKPVAGVHPAMPRLKYWSPYLSHDADVTRVLTYDPRPNMYSNTFVAVTGGFLVYYFFGRWFRCSRLLTAIGLQSSASSRRQAADLLFDQGVFRPSKLAH